MDGHVIVPSFAKPFRSRANHATPVTLRPSSSGEKYWLKVKSFEETDFDIVAVGDREAGDGSPGRGGRPVGSAIIILPAGIGFGNASRAPSPPARLTTVPRR